MKILDVQELKRNQFDAFRKRRTSQYMKFLDKNVDFVTYYSINKAESTFSLENRGVDSYIGEDSPIKYNKINNLPVYGISQVSNTTEYNEQDGGFSNENYTGEMILLPEILEPCENDVFILNIFDENRIFRINEVSQIVLKAKPHFIVSFHIEIPEYLDKLNKQVVAEFNAIFDNIGTEDKVIISSNDYDLRENYKDLYNNFYEYYINSFFKKKLTLFEVEFDSIEMGTKRNVHYIDKFLQKFMEDNRIIIMDKFIKGTLMLDYNNIFDSDDFKTYRETLYWAIINKDISNLKEGYNFIKLNKINSPFALTYASNSNWYYTGDTFTDSPNPDLPHIEFDFISIIQRCVQLDTSIERDNPYSRVLSIIVNYMNGNQIMPGYFSSLIGELTRMQEYELYPIIMYIIKDQVDKLIRLNKIL